MFLVIRVDVETLQPSILFWEEDIESCISYVHDLGMENQFMKIRDNGERFFEVYEIDEGFVYNTKKMVSLLKIFEVKDEE